MSLIPSRSLHFASPSLAATLIFATVSLNLSIANASPTRASADLMIRGVVPEVISASAEIHKGALTFTPKEQVRNRVIGKIRMKYNVPLGAIQISSNRPDGIPSSDLYGRYPFGRFGFNVHIGSCTGIDPTAVNPIVFPGGERSPVNIGSALQLTEGVDAVCELLASWDGAETALAEQGASYSVDYTISLSPAG